MGLKCIFLYNLKKVFFVSAIKTPAEKEKGVFFIFLLLGLRGKLSFNGFIINNQLSGVF